MSLLTPLYMIFTSSSTVDFLVRTNACTVLLSLLLRAHPCAYTVDVSYRVTFLYLSCASTMPTRLTFLCAHQMPTRRLTLLILVSLCASNANTQIDVSFLSLTFLCVHQMPTRRLTLLIFVSLCASNNAN